MDGARCVYAGFEVGKSEFLDRFLDDLLALPDPRPALFF
jgi:hypothetical protein